jgi:flagellin
MSDVSLSASIRSNLVSLKDTAKQLEKTTTHLSTGKKVSSAIDNPTNYFAAQNYYDRATSLSGRLDGMSEATQMINAADNGITNIKAFLSQMQGVVNDALANTDSDERRDLGDQFNELITQVRDMAKDASYGGINLIYGNASTTVQFNESIGQSTLDLQGFNISANINDAGADGEIQGAAGYVGTAGTLLNASTVTTAADAAGDAAAAAATSNTQAAYDAAYASAISAISGFALTVDLDGGSVVGIKSSGTDGDAWEIDWGGATYQTDLTSVISSIESFGDTLKIQSSKLANNLAIITQRQEYTENSINILEEGADNLTLADLNEEGANLLSLQTAQSLGVKSLTLASQQSSNVLSLLQ